MVCYTGTNIYFFFPYCFRLVPKPANKRRLSARNSQASNKSISASPPSKNFKHASLSSKDSRGSRLTVISLTRNIIPGAILNVSRDEDISGQMGKLHDVGEITYKVGAYNNQ